MKDNNFWQNVALAIVMLFCICVNIISIIMGIENENSISVIFGSSCIGICFGAIVYNIISVIENYKK